VYTSTYSSGSSNFQIIDFGINHGFQTFCKSRRRTAKDSSFAGSFMKTVDSLKVFETTATGGSLILPLILKLFLEPVAL